MFVFHHSLFIDIISSSLLFSDIIIPTTLIKKHTKQNTVGRNEDLGAVLKLVPAAGRLFLVS